MSSASSLATDLPPPLFLREPQVLAMVPISDATLWRWVKAKKFPQPVKLGPGTTAWRADDVRAWAQSFQPTLTNT
jgi:predicted DNA-binding transcriptional regulator AlpA